MLDRLFTHPIELTINDKPVMFNSVEDFEFALDARTAIPLDKITSAMKSSLHDLQQEAESITLAAENLSEVISKSPDISGGINVRLKTTDTSIFSKDNGWRDIMVGLNNDESMESCEYKQIALKTYMKYLSNRLGMIKSIQSELGKQSNSQTENGGLTQVKTGSFEVDDHIDPTVIAAMSNMTKLPKGKPVMFAIKPGDEIELVLAKYECRILIGAEDIVFIDNNGVAQTINIGINKVGRAQDCKVRFTSNMREISRVHLIIANHKNKKLEFTDMSTHGTYCHQHSQH